MTIQRQYQLPNCTLILEGMGSAIGGAGEARPLMSVLLNAECHLPGQEKPLTGGREFLESLVTAVSHYVQEILSEIHDFSATHTNSWIQLQRVNANHHRLVIRPQDALPGSGIATQLTREIDLNTVQLFDLVEAIDQFFADTQTLPDLSLGLTSVSRRFARREQPIAQRAIAPALGVSSLALAGAALFFAPIPRVQEPKNLFSQPPASSSTPQASPTASPLADAGSPSPTPTTPTNTASPSTAPTGTASPGSSVAVQPDLTNLESVLNTAPEITDPAELETLGQKLRTQVDEAWKQRTPFIQDLVYRVGVAKDGAIVGYKPVNPAALTNAKQVPLLDLLYRPATGSQPTSESIAQFKVVFTANGALEVAPWRESMETSLAGGAEITDSQQLEELLPKLRQTILQRWENKTPNFSKDLTFRVRVKPDGTVVDYRPEDQSAFDYAKDTPLPNLGKLADERPATLQEPHALFKVVFRAPSGRVEISPWRGWQN